MVKPVHRTKELKEEGDILHGPNWISAITPPSKLGFPRIPLAMPGYPLPWKYLKALDIEVDLLEKDFIYLCPYLDNTHYWFLPNALLLKDGDVNKYKNPCPQMGSFPFDLDWWKNHMREDDSKPNSLEQTFLGHGYTLPSDGSVELNTATVDLDKGDALFGWLWVWYNK